MRVDFGEVCAGDVRGVKRQFTVSGVRDSNAVGLEQPADDRNIRNRGDTAKDGGLIAKERRDHRLGDEVLGSANIDAADQRLSAVDGDGVDAEADSFTLTLRVFAERVHRAGNVVGRHDSR